MNSEQVSYKPAACLQLLGFVNELGDGRRFSASRHNDEGTHVMHFLFGRIVLERYVSLSFMFQVGSRFL